MDYFITCKGRYLRQVANGKIEMCSKDQAQRYEFSKAKNIMSNLPKEIRKFGTFKLECISDFKNVELTKPQIQVRSIYSTKPIKPPKKIMENTKPYEQQQEILDWMEKFVQLNEIVESASVRLDELSKELIDIEHELIDSYHDIELGKRVNACEGYKKYRSIRDVLIKRRKIKDEKKLLEHFVSCKPSTVDIYSLQEYVDGLSNRKYAYRNQ